jgi:peptidoglycan/LPS O-acetylase OafA/YrhL
MSTTADACPEPTSRAARDAPAGGVRTAPPETLSADTATEQTVGTAPPAVTTEQPVRPARAARLPQLDVMRLIVCFFVVATHVVSNANPMQAVAPNAVVNLLHFTRQAFFFISALVLVHSAWGRVGPDGRLAREAGQLRRRVSVLGVPYLWWSAFYVVLGLVTAYSLWALKRLWWTYLSGLIQGTDGYHMYFLLVSVEFAVVFPLFLRLLHATRGRHGLLLLGSGLVEVALMAVYHYVGQPEGWWRPFIGEASLTAYQFWLVLGGVAALHLAHTHAWLTRHARLLWVALLATGGLAMGVFWAEVAAGEEPEFAGRSLQPVTVPLALATIGVLYVVSVRISAIRASRVQRALSVGTYLSFGIYLSHPAILTGLLLLQRRLPGGMAWHPIATTSVILLLDFLLAALVSQVLSRTPWSKALTGRPRRRTSCAGPASDPRSSDQPSPVLPGPRVPAARPGPALAGPAHSTRLPVPGGRSGRAHRERSGTTAPRRAQG